MTCTRSARPTPRSDGRRTLTGRRRFERALAALDATPGRAPDGRIPATFEVIYGHAWKGAPRRTAEGHAIVTFERPGRP